MRTAHRERAGTTTSDDRLSPTERERRAGSDP